MSTVRDLIKGSLRLIGAIDPGESLSASEGADGLTSLNELVESLALENLMLHQTLREEFDLVSSQGSYTIGDGGDFDTDRPVRVKKAAVEIQGSTPYEIPIEILSSAKWEEISNKDLTGEFPTKVFFTGSSPLQTAKVWPVPLVANKLVLYSDSSISQFTNLNNTLDLPPGYFKMLRYNLAVALAPEYGRQVSAEVAAIAMDSKDKIKTVNFEPQLMTSDAALVRKRADILAGE